MVCCGSRPVGNLPGMDASSPDAIDGGDAGPLGPDPAIAGMVAAIAEDRVAASITMLAGMGTRHTCSSNTGTTTGIGAARDWIRAQMSAVAGLQVRLAPYAQTCGSTPVSRDNVVGVLPGAHPERIVIIGGHYDSRTLDVTDSASPAP